MSLWLPISITSSTTWEVLDEWAGWNIHNTVYASQLLLLLLLRYIQLCPYPMEKLSVQVDVDLWLCVPKATSQCIIVITMPPAGCMSHVHSESDCGLERHRKMYQALCMGLCNCFVVWSYLRSLSANVNCISDLFKTCIVVFWTQEVTGFTWTLRTWLGISRCS